MALFLFFISTSLFADSNCVSIEEFDRAHQSKFPEHTLKKLMDHLSDDEVFIRLIMAETVASTCPSLDVAKGIAWVIKNRVQANNESRYGLGRDVVFKEFQFRSTTGGCDVAQRKIFLCPSKSDYELAKKAYFEIQNESNPLEETFQYFFFKHFNQSQNCARWRGVVPEWASDQNEVDSKLPIDRSCVRFFR